MKTPERCQWSRSGIFIVNCEHISAFALIIDSEQENLCWVFLKNTKTFEDKIVYYALYCSVLSVNQIF